MLTSTHSNIIISFLFIVLLVFLNVAKIQRKIVKTTLFWKKQKKIVLTYLLFRKKILPLPLK